MSQDRAVLLYGSHARGDADDMSDVDVLIIGATAPKAEEIVGLLPAACVGPLHISRYTWREIAAMRDYGSLFLQHIATEAKVVQLEGCARKRLAELLMSLPPYRLARRDLDAFRVTVRDVEAGLEAGLPPAFEMAVLGGVARHASVLGCFLRGRPTFGRISISLACELLHLPDIGRGLELAHRFRLHEEGQCKIPREVSSQDVARIVDGLSIFLDRLEVMIDANAA